MKSFPTPAHVGWIEYVDNCLNYGSCPLCGNDLFVDKGLFIYNGIGEKISSECATCTCWENYDFLG